MLVDATWNGAPRKLMLWGNRNGFFYVLDRATGEFLLGEPLHEGQLGERPGCEGPADPDAAAAGQADVPRTARRDQLVLAVVQPAHRAVLSLDLGELRDRCSTQGEAIEYREGQNFTGGNLTPAPGASADAGHAARTDQHLARGRRSRRRHGDRSRRPARRSGRSRCTTSRTSGDPDDRDSTCCSSADAKATSRRSTRATGTLLWKASVGGEVAGSADVSYQVDGKQYVAIAAGHSLFTYALR